MDPSNEAFRVMGPGGLKGPLTLFQPAVGSMMMAIIGGEHGDPCVALLGVVPREERPAEGDGSGAVVEAPREAGMVLQGELRLGERVVIGQPGRLSERVPPRLASSCAAHLLVIGAPRIALRASMPGD